MLKSCKIPIHEDEPEDWQRFLLKAAKGSVKATEMLSGASMAYMVALTGDPAAPSTLDTKEYAELFRRRFPVAAPSDSVDSLIELGCRHGWFPQRFSGRQHALRDAGYYQNLWDKQRVVEWSDLAHDALVLCIEKWSAAHCLECLEEDSTRYNSRNVVSGMLYLALTWPDETRRAKD